MEHAAPTPALADDGRRWARRTGLLALGVLVLATGVALASGPYTGATDPGWRLATQLVLAGCTGALVGWRTFASDPRHGRSYFVTRTVLALALTLLNPLFCIFAWIGYIDANDHFRERAATWWLGVTAVIMALGQSGGVPWANAGAATLFGVLLLVNLGLALTMNRWSLETQRTSEQRADVIARLEQALAENAELHETVLAQARAAGVQEERQRLAGELHDTIAQTLAAVLAQLQAARDAPENASERVARATELAREALAQARRSVQALAPVELGDGELGNALDGLVTAWREQHGVKADLVVTGEARPLHPEVEATLVRVTQESLANVAKHAAAQRVGVTLTYDEDEVILDVRDDGTGFDPGAARPQSFGLRGMQQRAARLAGVLEVESSPGTGTALSVRLPALARGAA